MQLSFYVLILLFILFLSFYFFQNNLIYFPDRQAPTQKETQLPDMQLISITTDDGLNLSAWYHPPSLPNLSTLIYFHGNAGHIGHRAAHIKSYLKTGYGVLFLAYRGFSGNPGTPSEKGFYKDARAAIKFLLSKNMSDSCLVLIGESLGTAVAIQMATEYNVAALILQSPFTSLTDVGQFHYPFFPVKWLLRDKYNSLSKISQVQCPVLVILAENDKTIPLTLSQKLFDAIAAPKKLFIAPHQEHNGLNESKEVIHFLKENVHCFESL